ncbi:MAG: glycosyltransferase [Actinobacteria bacterium]|nr:glycosyltransferase [Actinomycetota bacterium]
MELARSLEDAAPERVASYLLNPDLALPGGIEPLVAAGKLRFVDEAAYPDGALLHVASPFELSIPLDRLIPPAARRLRLVVTLFDLIPEAMPEQYLQDPGLRRRYRARRELVRQADHVVAISRHSAGEAVRLLGVHRDRVSTVELAPAPAFRPPASREAALDAARAAVGGLERDYVLYTGGSDPRKNVEGLLEGWGRLPAAVRERWQLVLACHLPPLRRHHFEVMADQRGFGRRFLVTGWVSEETLVALNQAAALFVFPSLAEGFGLPLAEALACATPAIGANRTAVPELLAPEALFDASDPDATAAAITQALTDEGHRRRLSEHAARPPRTWAEVAAGTLAVYDRVVAQRHRPLRRDRPAGAGGRGRLRMALATPLPPQGGGVADYSTRLLEELRELCEVDALVDGPPHERASMEAAQAPDGVAVHRLASLERLEALARPYDGVVYSIGNSEFHTGALAMLSRRPGVVLAHDVRLTNLYRFAAWQHPEAAPGGFHATLQRMYAGRVPEHLGGQGWIDNHEAERWGVLMAREVIGHSRRFLATSAFAAELARLDARAGDRGRIDVLPFSLGAVPLAAPTPADRRRGPPVVASFGMVNVLKQAPLVVEAFAEAAGAVGAADAQLVFVGPASAADAGAVHERARQLGVASRVQVTGELDDQDYLRWLDRAWVAVQLRAATNGESSGAIGDCLTAGVPTVITAIGPNRAVPGTAAVAIPAGAGARQLADVLVTLLADPARRGALGRGAREYAAAHSFARAAEALYEVVSSLG